MPGAQLSSMPLQISPAPGCTLASLSSQSEAFETVPPGWLQEAVITPGSPNESPSASAYHGDASTASSSIEPSQSSSRPLQRSFAPGWTFVRKSSQSVASPTKPVGAAHAEVVEVASPYESESVSAYQVR